MATMALDTGFLLFGILVFGISYSDSLDCESIIQRTDITRLEKIYMGCLGNPSNVPKLKVNQVCTLVEPISRMFELDATTPETRPIKDDLTYHFQKTNADWRITGDVINTIAGLSLETCSQQCTDDPTCFAFSFKNGGDCVIASSCTPAGVVDVGYGSFNAGYWY